MITCEESLLLVAGRLTADVFEPIEFLNKQNLIIDAAWAIQLTSSTRDPHGFDRHHCERRLR
jgi:hypothetical protein